MNLAFRDEVPPVPTNNSPRFALSPRLMLLGIIGVVLVIVSVLLISLSSSNSITPQLQRLSVRLETMQKMIDGSKKSITNPDLNKLNSDLSILTAGSIARLKDPLKDAGMGTVGEDIKKAEADPTTIQKLEDAKLTGTFDRSYVRIMTNKIDTILVLMNSIYDKTSSGSLKSALSASYGDILSVKNQLTALNV